MGIVEVLFSFEGHPKKDLARPDKCLLSPYFLHVFEESQTPVTVSFLAVLPCLCSSVAAEDPAQVLKTRAIRFV